jgi:WD40 repeat protein
VAFSPGGKLLASGSTDGTVQRWNAATGHPVGPPLTGQQFVITQGPFITPDDTIYSVAFSPDGKTLASGSADGTVQRWNAATGHRDGPPMGGQHGHVFISGHEVTSVAFSPGGKLLASGGADGSVRLWDVATSQQIGGPLTGHTGPVTSVAFSPDGKTLASGSTDHTVRLWDAPYAAGVLPYLCALPTQSLTSAEWAQYLSSGLAYHRVCHSSPLRSPPPGLPRNFK